MMRFFFLTLTTLLFCACGGGYNPDIEFLKKNSVHGGYFYSDIGNDQKLSAISLKEISGGTNFQIKFTLATGGSLFLYTFAQSNLNRGVNFKFKNENGKLQVLVSAQNQTQDWSSYFGSIDTSQEIELAIDVHNNESPAHIMVWSGPKRAGLNYQNTLYNSAEDSIDINYDASPGVGFGRSWGYKVEHAQFLNAVISNPQDAHE